MLSPKARPSSSSRSTSVGSPTSPKTPLSTKQEATQSSWWISGDAVDSCNKDDIRKLCWGTTSGDYDKKVCVRGEGRGENFDTIHSMGQKPSKYMQIPKMKAKGFDRCCVTYNAEFYDKESSSKTNNTLCQLYSMRGQGPQPLSPSKGGGGGMSLTSSYRGAFAQPSTEETLASTTANMHERFSKTNVFKGNVDMFVTKSHAHTQYVEFPRFSSFKGGPPSANLTLSSFSAPMSSTYRAEHGAHGLTRLNSAPESISAFKDRRRAVL